MAVIEESGVIMYFSFLLLEQKFITTFKERYTANTIPTTLVAFAENHNVMIPPICKSIITKNTCKISCVISTTLSFFGKTLYWPPIVSSPNGRPKIRRIDSIITIERRDAPRSGIIVFSFPVLYSNLFYDTRMQIIMPVAICYRHCHLSNKKPSLYIGPVQEGFFHITVNHSVAIALYGYIIAELK